MYIHPPDDDRFQINLSLTMVAAQAIHSNATADNYYYTVTMKYHKEYGMYGVWKPPSTGSH